MSVLRAEAAWLARELGQLATSDLSPLLSLGSGHGELTADQPWIHSAVYEPLERRGVRVLHHELAHAPGVDVVGDLTDPEFLRSLSELRIRSVLCCNVLEHLPNPASVASAIERMVAHGGYALVTLPRRFPYHPGPIDTRFRPAPHELRRLFHAPHKRIALNRGVRSVARRGGNAGPVVPIRDTVRMMVASTAVSAVILRRE